MAGGVPELWLRGANSSDAAHHLLLDNAEDDFL